LIIGFNQRHSDQVVDLGGCLLLRRDIADLLPRFREIFTPLIPVGAAGDLFVTDSDNGPDVRLDFPEQPTLEVREGLVQAAQRLDLARLTLRIKGVDEPLIVNRPAVVSFAGIPVTLPVGGFLQPSAEGEAALLTLIEEGLNGADGPIIDLFAGLGTFSLPLSQHRKVTAWEGDLVAATALAAAAPARVQTHRRDLFREPLMTHDWQGISAIVLDPPRAGANSQAEVLARSPDAPGKLVYVSCNPATLARDAATLAEGGYRLTGHDGHPDLEDPDYK
jgi:23S rRNA (uracil1939-C5)-methyltransferase